MSTLAALACIEVSASHLDNKNGIFDTYSFDQVKFKSRTNCSLDKYPEVSLVFHLSSSLLGPYYCHESMPEFNTNVYFNRSEHGWTLTLLSSHKLPSW